ncbi:hypothetical protein BaRGS_00025428 [Batillaria attramentaria]|uniref:Uncharacterized protein n=1 Tax=Batillaria attramentaria TaxID=370345 RepID=A0ABD0K864_9CAEN
MTHECCVCNASKSHEHLLAQTTSQSLLDASHGWSDVRVAFADHFPGPKSKIFQLFPRSFVDQTMRPYCAFGHIQ